MSKAFKKENCWDLCICTHTSWYSDKFSWWLRRSENESDNHRINPAEWQVSIPVPKQVWVIEPATSLLLAHLAYSFCSFSCSSMETCRKMFRKQETLVRMWTIALRTHCPATINWSYLHHCLTLHGPCPKGPSVAMHRNASECIGMHPLLLHLRKHAKYYRVISIQ